MIHLVPYERKNYPLLISWIEDEEALMQFGGPTFTFPLTIEQLDRSMADKNRTAFHVVDEDTNEIIGHCETYQLEFSIKFARILIGDKRYRGKGLCQPIMKALIDFATKNYPGQRIELNVFDWNTGAIKCYEKVGFKINPLQVLERKVKGQTWKALNMVLDR